MGGSRAPLPELHVARQEVVEADLLFVQQFRREHFSVQLIGSENVPIIKHICNSPCRSAHVDPRVTLVSSSQRRQEYQQKEQQSNSTHNERRQ